MDSRIKFVDFIKVIDFIDFRIVGIFFSKNKFDFIDFQRKNAKNPKIDKVEIIVFVHKKSVSATHKCVFTTKKQKVKAKLLNF